MLRNFSFVGICTAAILIMTLLVGCPGSHSVVTSGTAGSQSQHGSSGHAGGDNAAGNSTDQGEHGHKTGAHGGIIVSLGRDSHHVEAIVTSDGRLQLYTLGSDESRVMDIESQQLAGFVKPAGGADATEITIQPLPQAGDAQGKTSLFVAQLPEPLVGKSIDVTVPNITIGGERFRLGFTTRDSMEGTSIPKKVADAAERDLYLTPGGVYAKSDIEANGNMTASQKFHGFKASHDRNPKPGDTICPITLTKANPNVSWIIGGKTYEFCCPPCVDEFVQLAKTKPENVKAPEDYVQAEGADGTE